VLGVLNYGYESSEPTIVPTDDPDHRSLRLYEHVVRGVDLGGAQVLEVSCGRGGGAAFLMRAYAPTALVGLDLSAENVRIARERAGGPQFMIGDAEHLPFEDETFDVVVNIEASHLYDDRRRFFAEVRRVLRPGGHFCYADGCWAGDDCSSDLTGAGLTLLDRHEITANVVEALERDSPRREALFDTIADERVRNEYKDWGGVVGHRAYRRFASRETLYFAHLLRRD
jgi:SAM-dependent methyltransferase